MTNGAELSRLVALFLDRTVEYRRLQTSQNNVLLEGPDPVVDAVLAVLKPHLSEPVAWHLRGAPLELMADQRGTLIFRDVSALSAEEQNTLVRWLDDSSHRVQIVSASATPVFPLVGGGLFDDSLYYRLNVMLLHVEFTNTAVRERW